VELNYDPKPSSEQSTPPKSLRTVDDQARTMRRIGLVLLAVLAAVLIWSLSKGSDSASPATTKLETADAAIEGRADRYIEVRDDGHTLIVDGNGEQVTGAGVTTIATILAILDVPDSVVARMDSTRALDGVQEASWDGLTATWTYHPDDGLDIIITD
jgi:hypothetical protein